jgi:predicted ArsR family transcriptional regulator
MSTQNGRERARTLHPTRVAIIDAMRDGKPRSPVELSKMIDATLGATAYHVRKLTADGVLRLFDERRVRGAVEHIYKIDGRRLRTLPEGLAGVALQAADVLERYGNDPVALDTAKRLRRAAAATK